MKIFDAHFHIIDPKFPLIANQDFLPDTFTSEDYRRKTAQLDIQGGAVVSGSFQAFDQNYLIAALQTLGPGFVGVTQLPNTASDEEIIQLSHQGIKAVRFNIFRDDSLDINHLESFAHRIYELVGWHVELYIDSKQLANLMTTLLTLPKVSIDHLGLSAIGFDELLTLVVHNVKVKASGFMRVDFDVLTALKAIYQTNPNALMFGTDLPGTRASRIFSQNDLLLIKNHFSESAVHKILWQNATDFYGISL